MTPRYARLASKLFVREGGGAPPPPTLEARERAIAVVSAILAARARKRRIVRWSAVAAAAAVVITGLSGARLMLHRASGPDVIASRAHGIEIVAKSVGDGASVVLSGAPTPAPLSEGRTVPAGSRLVTPPNSRATLAFSTGTTVTLGEATDLTVNAEGPMQLLRLGTGFIDLHVAKLTSAQRFVVTTSDSEVEVRGTQFRVSLAQPDPACGGGITTRVAVTEGVVVVRHEGIEARVAAGETWPCAMSTTAPSIGDDLETSGGSARTATGSVLAEVNALFGQAMAAKNRGDTRASIAALDRLLARYPTVQLAEYASSERMRLLKSTGSPRAVSAAKRYLIAYPKGYARAEAEAIVAGTP
jgi:ferric-dicitrate binding protein FerR (iron transport regulator)